MPKRIICPGDLDSINVLVRYTQRLADLERGGLMSKVYCCETVSEQRAARCIVAPGDPDQRRWEQAHPGTPPPVPRVEKHETPERD